MAFLAFPQLDARLLCLLAAGAAGGFVLALGARFGWRGAASWVALALVAQAAILQTIDAGKLIRFQHFTTPGDLVRGGQFHLLGIICFQVVAVILGLIRAWPSMRNALPRAHSLIRWLAFAGITLLTGVALSRDLRGYVHELLWAGLLHATNLGNIVLAIWHLPPACTERLRRWFAPSSAPPHLDRPAWVTAALVTIASAGLSYFIYQAHPHVPDEVAYLIQARYFANGAMALTPPPVPEGFELYLLANDSGRWYSCFPPGWPLVLAVGYTLGAPWLVNPILAGICVLGLYKLVWLLYDRAVARVALLLAACSPWLLFMGMNLMAHSLTLAAALGGALAVVRARRIGSPWWAIPAGACIGLVALIRPYDGFLLAVLLGLWVLLGRGVRRRWTLAATLALSTALCAAAVLPYNRYLTGGALKFPVEDYFDKKWWPGANSIGFGPQHGLSWNIDAFPGHSPLEAAINAALNLSSINADLFGWMCGSLVLAAAVLVSGALDRRDLPAVAALFGIPFAYSFYWYSGGPDFGARYWYLTIVPLIILSVRALDWLTAQLSPHLPEAREQLLAGVAILCALAVVTYIPWRCVDKYYGYLRMRPDVRELAKGNAFNHGLVFVRGAEHPDYASAAVYNPLDFGRTGGSAPVYVWDRSPEVYERLVRAYPDRPVWILDGPSLTGRGYEIVSRPGDHHAQMHEGQQGHE